MNGEQIRIGNLMITKRPMDRSRLLAERLCDHEREILAEVCGDIPARPWGAAVGAAIEVLVGHDLLDDAWRPTPLGKQVNALRSRA